MTDTVRRPDSARGHDVSIRIVQLTDLHLHRDPRARLAGIDTWATLRTVLEHVERRHGDFDYLILTGDLAQDEMLETYLMLREALGEWVGRCRIIPGNHDDRSNLRTAFPELFPGPEGPLTFTLRRGGWCIIGLDSRIPGAVGGAVDAAQVAWLAAELAREPAVPALLFVHHPPTPINVAWIDELGLRDPADLVALIEASRQVRAVYAGHVHQAYSGRLGAAAMYTTPSTSVQFAARAERAFDTAAAGYRTIVLDDSGQRTEVHRVTEDRDRGPG